MLVREIILENFMSYEYGRIPLKPGVNLICGPNGAGKSSILLGISVALGQSYTERSKKLSDLIRRGKDIGRVTLVLDNSRRDGKRRVTEIAKSIEDTRKDPAITAPGNEGFMKVLEGYLSKNMSGDSKALIKVLKATILKRKE